MTDVVFVLLLLATAINTAAIVAFVLWQSRYRLDVGRIAGVMAADLLERYEAGELEETAVRTFVRERYASMCALFGLPTAPGDVIADRVWGHVTAAAGERPARALGERALYE